MKSNNVKFNLHADVIVRINPAGNRVYRNNSDESMVFMCIQTMAGSLDCYVGSDGLKTDGAPVWEN